MNPIKAFLVSMLAGIFIQNLYLTAPIHEFGHLIVAAMFGYRATFHLTEVIIHGHMPFSDLVPIMYAGVVFETALFSLLSIHFSKTKPWVSGLSFGIAANACLTAGLLKDIDAIGRVGIVGFLFFGGILMALLFVGDLYRIAKYRLS